MTPLRVADLNLRPPHAPEWAIERCSLAPWVKVNTDELHVLGCEMRPTKGLTPRRYYNTCWWEASDPNQVLIVTDGPDGVTVVTGKHDEFYEPGVPADVVDTVGAGDAFMAGLLTALQADGRLGHAALSGLDATALSALLRRAQLVAARTCAHKGAVMPHAAELASPAPAPLPTTPASPSPQLKCAVP